MNQGVRTAIRFQLQPTTACPHWVVFSMGMFQTQRAWRHTTSIAPVGVLGSIGDLCMSWEAFPSVGDHLRHAFEAHHETQTFQRKERYLVTFPKEGKEDRFYRWFVNDFIENSSTNRFLGISFFVGSLCVFPLPLPLATPFLLLLFISFVCHVISLSLSLSLSLSFSFPH